MGMDRIMAQAQTTNGVGLIDERVGWVDIAKGICIVLVVMMHSTLGVGERLGGEGFLHHVVAFALPFRMPDFFLISGLFLARAIDRDWRGFTDRKVLHFVYFYAIWVTIQAAFKAPAMIAAGDHAGLMALALAPLEPFGTLWFIYLLPIFFVLTKVARPVPPALLLLTAAAHESARVHTGWIVIDEFCARYVYFLAGWLAAPLVFRLADHARRHVPVMLAALAVWALVNGVFAFTPTSSGRMLAQLPGVSIVLGMAGAMAVVVAAALIDRFNLVPVLRLLGRNSLSVYLAFFLPMAVSRSLLIGSGLVTDVGLVSLIVTLCGLAGPLVLAACVRGTALAFLFERPKRFHLADRASRPTAIQPAE
jgi:uncharacterized membrane protein YcfT